MSMPVDRYALPVQRSDQVRNLVAARRACGTGFSGVLKERLGELKVSAHAGSRIRSRNIDMTPEVVEKLQQAVDSARRKGSRDSLILLRDKAFIVNIPNRTIITAMDGESLRENVFTNIDSTVIAG